MAKILLVEDDVALARMIGTLLLSQRHTVEIVYDGFDARHRVSAFKYDLLILDWNLPNVTGIELCKEFRDSGGHTPVLMLTAKGSSHDKVEGLDSGADDYVTKPFDSQEFLSRVRALVRRNRVNTETIILTAGDLNLNLASAVVTKGGQEIRLFPKEFALLEFFMRHQGQYFLAEALVDRVWSSESEITAESIRPHINRLRKKLDDPGKPSKIHTSRGLGYKFDPGQKDAGTP